MGGGAGDSEQHPYGAGVVAARPDAGRRWGRWAVALTIVAALVHLGSLAIRGIAVDRVPWGNMYEFTLVVALVATIAWLVTLTRMPQLRYLGLFVMMPVLVLMFLAGTLYTKAVEAGAGAAVVLAGHPRLLDRRRRGHPGHLRGADRHVPGPIPATSAAAPAGSLAGAPGCRRPPRWTRRPTVRSPSRFPIYTAGVIFGAIWAEAAWGRYWGWDPKETWAFIAWVIYAMYLHARATAGWRGSRAAYINLLGFAAMTFNFFVVNIVISGLHSYAGLN